MLRNRMLLGLLLVALPAAGAGAEAEERLERLAVAVDDLEQRLGHVRDALDQTRFDPDELLFELAFDAGEITGFVSAEIAYQPYAGLLRGIRGTLQSRAGNSLDQSVLLAYLLKSAGYQARVVRGSLSGEEAALLLAGTAAANAPADFTKVARVAEQQFGDLSALTAGPVDMAATDTAGRARDAEAVLMETLSGAGVQLPKGAPLAPLQHYFWVEWRRGAGRDWQAVHPAMSDVPATAEVEEYFAEEVPERYQHTVTFSAHIRRRIGNDFETVRLMDDWTRPAANLHGVSLRFHNMPAGLQPGEGRELLQDPRANRILIPLFNGAAAPGAVGFDLRGRPVDSMVAGQGEGGAAGLFAELGEQLDEAAGVIRNPDDPGSAFGLDAMWLEWTLTAPDGTRRTQRRYLHGPGQGGPDEPLPSVLPLLTEYTYVINVGSLTEDYLVDRYLATAVDSTGMLQALAARLLAEPDGDSLPAESLPENFAAFGLYPLMDRNPLAPPQTVAVRGEPAIIGVRSGLRDERTGFVGVDVVFNRMLHVAGNGSSGQQHDPRAALGRGVWETALERLPNRVRDQNAGFDVFKVFAAAAEQGVPLRVLEPATAIADSISPDPRERALLQRDLSDGHVVVVPARRPAGLPLTGWWRIDPDSGTTLGMTGDGHGAETIEYITQLVNIPLTFIGVVVAVYDLGQCQEAGDLEQMCCLVEKHLDNVGGLGFGGVLGASLGGAAAATYGVVDLGVQAATAVVLDERRGISPDVVNLGCNKLIEDKSWF